jgi:hypothetical protein
MAEKKKWTEGEERSVDDAELSDIVNKKEKRSKKRAKGLLPHNCTFFLGNGGCRRYQNHKQMGR